MRVLIFTLALAFLPVPDRENPVPKEAKSLSEELQGEWTVDKVERNGQEVPKEKITSYRFIFSGTDFTLVEPRTRFGKGTFALDAKIKPVQIDIFLDHMKSGEKIVFLGILEVQGDQAKWCYTERSEQRPTEFKAPQGDSDTRVFYLKRVKK